MLIPRGLYISNVHKVHSTYTKFLFTKVIGTIFILSHNCKIIFTVALKRSFRQENIVRFGNNAIFDEVYLAIFGNIAKQISDLAKFSAWSGLSVD